MEQDLYTAQKHLSGLERVKSELPVMHPGVTQSTSEEGSVGLGFFFKPKCHLLIDLYSQGFLAQKGSLFLINLPRKDTLSNSQEG